MLPQRVRHFTTVTTIARFHSSERLREFVPSIRRNLHFVPNKPSLQAMVMSTTSYGIADGSYRSKGVEETKRLW
jgi:hypothetical protein